MSWAIWDQFATEIDWNSSKIRPQHRKQNRYVSRVVRLQISNKSCCSCCFIPECYLKMTRWHDGTIATSRWHDKTIATSRCHDESFTGTMHDQDKVDKSYKYLRCFLSKCNMTWSGKPFSNVQTNNKQRWGPGCEFHSKHPWPPLVSIKSRLHPSAKT